MSRNVELPDDVYAHIEAEATAAGITVAAWIAARAPQPCAEPCPPASVTETKQADENSNGRPPRTLADEFVGLLGLIDSGRTDLSQRTGELFGKGMVKKRQEGRL